MIFHFESVVVLEVLVEFFFEPEDSILHPCVYLLSLICATVIRADLFRSVIVYETFV